MTSENRQMEEVGIDATTVDLAVLIIEEAAGNSAQRIKVAVWWLMNAGLAPHQAIRATTLARRRLGGVLAF